MKEEEVNFGCGGSCHECSGCAGAHEETEDTGILTFTDEEGNDVKFEILDVVAMDEKEYLVVLPVEGMDLDDEEEGNVLILEIKQEDGEEVYDTVADDEEAEKVFKKFQEQNDILDDEEVDEEETEE
jgi:uncharacterized protein YrzB (UPF0473 family)